MDPIVVLLILLPIGAVCYGVYWLYDRYRTKTFCPTCGGEMTYDAAKYRYTVEWTCLECGETFEQLRGGK